MRIGADPLGGASVDYWAAIAERHGLDLTVVNPLVDPTWRFMTLDWDGKIRMDCSSPYAMASLIDDASGRRYEIATGNDADADRHGIVTPDAGLLNPNHYLAVAIELPLRAPRRLGRPTPRSARRWSARRMIDRVAAEPRPAAGRGAGRVQVVRARPARRVGRRSAARSRAGASFLRRDGAVWTTDKDGILLACSPRRSRGHRRVARRSTTAALTATFGDPAYARVDAPATREQKAVLAKLSPEQVTRDRAGRRADHRQADRRRPATARAIGGLKVDHRVRRGSRPGRPAPRTSTRSTPSRSAGPSTWREVQEAAREVVSAALAG